MASERLHAELCSEIIGAAIEVHRNLGPGLIERIYHECLSRELRDRGLAFRTQVGVPVTYKGESLDLGFRLDFVVEDAVVIELKSVKAVSPVHHAQLLSYLKLSSYRVGLLLNFNSALMRDGIVRRVL